MAKALDTDVVVDMTLDLARSVPGGVTRQQIATLLKMARTLQRLYYKDATKGLSKEQTKRVNRLRLEAETYASGLRMELEHTASRLGSPFALRTDGARIIIPVL